MPRLVIFGENPAEFTLEEGSTSIGRSSLNDITLDDKSVSKRHALITYQIMKNGDHKVQLADLHSTNGTYINGSKVNYHTLEAGDQLSIGTVACTYVEELE